jgi:hypothetical protein
MKKSTMIKTAMAAAVLLSALGLAASAAGPAPAQAGKAVVLEYKMPEGRTLTYKNTQESGQVMDVMGQTVDSSTTAGGTYTFKAKGLKDKNFLLGVTIDDMTTTVSGPQGDLSPDLTSVKGKSFDMVLSPLGSEIDVSGAEAITFTSANGTSSVAAGFKLFFPDLPGKPVKAGDTWESAGGVDQKSESMNVRLDFKNLDTFDGLETVDGMECARIKSQVTATISGTGNQQGMDVAISGTGKGTNTWYFAIKDGIYVKSTSDMTMEMAISVSAAGMTIPMTQTQKGELTLTAKK